MREKQSCGPGIALSLNRCRQKYIIPMTPTHAMKYSCVPGNYNEKKQKYIQPKVAG